MLDDFTPGDGVVECAHPRIQHAFIVDLHNFISHDHLSDGHLGFLDDDGEVQGRCLLHVEEVGGPLKDETQFAVRW